MENADFTVCKVTLVRQKRYSPKYSLNMAGRQYNGLTLVLSGALHLTYPDGTEAKAHEADIILQREGDFYRLEAADGGETQYIVISYLAEPSETLAALLPDTRVYSPKHRNRYRDAFERAVRVYASYGICNEPLLRALVQEILCDIIRESSPSTAFHAESPVAYAKHYIEEHFDRSLCAQDLALAAGCSLSHLRMLFKQTYGEPPMRYLNRMRVEHAKEMLRSNLFHLEEIADACGFQNVYYFSRVFKSFTGISPGKY